jgi:hypothetical protein
VSRQVSLPTSRRRWEGHEIEEIVTDPGAGDKCAYVAANRAEVS